MGMFDIIDIGVIECSYCKELTDPQFQTKDGPCLLRCFELGDYFLEGAGKIDVIGSCSSFKCGFEAAKESVWRYGYYGGFSRSFDALIYRDKYGKILNKLKISKLHQHRGTMIGVPGELLNDKSNKRTKSGWLDKFDKDNSSCNDGRGVYENILYLYNLEDSEEAMRYWFVFRYKLDKIIVELAKLRIETCGECRSAFLSNSVDVMLSLVNE